MQRRRFLATLGVSATAATASCGALQSSTTLSDPTLNADSPSRHSLHFSDDGEEI